MAILLYMVIIWRLDDDEEGEEERRLIDLRLASPQVKKLTSSEAISRHACLCVGFGALQDEGKIISSWQASAYPPTLDDALTLSSLSLVGGLS